MSEGLVAQDVFILAGIGLLLTVYGSLVSCGIYRKLQQCRQCSLRSSISRWCYALKGRIACASVLQRAGEVTDGLEQYVDARVTNQAVEDFRQLVTYFACIVAIRLVAVFLNICRGAPRWGTLGDDALNLVGFTILLLFCTFPKLINGRSLMFWYSVLMGYVLGKLWIASTLTDLFFRSSSNWVLRYILGVVLRKPFMVGCWQVAYVACSWYRFAELSQEVQSDITMSQHVIFELVVMLTITVFSHQEAKSSRDKIRSEVASATLKGERSAMARMLELVCDVVVELGAGLQIKHGADKLAALLNLGGSSKTVTGMRLQDFIPLDEDKERLEECLSACPSMSERNDGSLGAEPNILHVKLRDAMGTHLSVELFYTQVKHFDERGFFVGIHEQADHCIPELPPFEKKAEANLRPGMGRAAAERRGTPPVMVGRSLASEEDESPPPTLGQSSCASATSATSAGEPTHIKGIALVLCQAFKSWVVHGADTSCCPFHAACAAAKASLSEMERYDCVPSFGEHQGPQCQCERCGVLHAAAEPRRPHQGSIGHRQQKCSACGHGTTRPFKPRSQLQSNTAEGGGSSSRSLIML